jgi:hypothetical protein
MHAQGSPSRCQLRTLASGQPAPNSGARHTTRDRYRRKVQDAGKSLSNDSTVPDVPKSFGSCRNWLESRDLHCCTRA